MSSVVYAIVFKGEILEGFESFSVKAHLARMLKADQEKMATLFSGKQIVLKKTADKQQALKYGSALKKTGADVKIRVIKSTQETPTGPQTVAAGNAHSEVISLLANEGNIFDAEPEQAALELDLSGISAAEVGEGLLLQPKQAVPLELDLSGISMAEVGDGMLAEPTQEVDKVAAPDFGLDQPGAVLETLKVAVEPVNPDISDLSMADAGADILRPEDRNQTPAPEPPDTSSIQLVPDADR